MIDVRAVPCTSCSYGYDRPHSCDVPEHCPCDRGHLHPSAGSPGYEDARARLVALFQEAWHQADTADASGHRTEAGIDAVLAALRDAVQESNPIAWRQEYLQIIEALGRPR